MTDQAQSEILENNPVGKGLDAFRTYFNSICEDRGISCTADNFMIFKYDNSTSGEFTVSSVNLSEVSDSYQPVLGR